MKDDEYVAAIDYGAHRDGFDELQQLVAARHHVLLGRDDPIAMLQTVNEHLVQQTADALERAQTAALTKFGYELELSAAAWKCEARALVERSIEAARSISAAQIEQATLELLAVLANERERTRATINRAAAVNTFVLAIALVVLGLVWLH